MLRTLKEPIAWTVKGVTRSLGHAGGVPQIIDRCIGRMRHWFTLLRAAALAEFPAFEIQQARSVFDVAASANPRTHRLQLNAIRDRPITLLSAVYLRLEVSISLRRGG